MGRPTRQNYEVCWLYNKSKCTHGKSLSCNGVNPEKDASIQELLGLGLEPAFEIIEIVYEGRDVALERESSGYSTTLIRGVHSQT